MTEGYTSNIIIPLVVLIVSVGFYSICYKFSYNRGKAMSNQDTLPDLGHEHTPNISELPYNPVSFMILALVLYLVITALYRGELYVLKSYILVESVSIALKGIIMISTTYPDSAPHTRKCVGHLSIDRNCYDMMYSGHTAVLVTTILTLVYYGYAPVELYALIPVGMFCIISYRSHYTSDVIVGFLISVLLFRAFHCR